MTEPNMTESNMTEPNRSRDFAGKPSFATRYAISLFLLASVEFQLHQELCRIT
jgi:hypothetical protein